MMSAIEAAEARKQQAQSEPKPIYKEPEPEPDPPSPASELVRPASSRTSAARYSVSLTLDPHVHQFFAEAAEKDERTLAKYLARVLRQQVDAELKKRQAEKSF